jgi:hypothetical protein
MSVLGGMQKVEEKGGGVRIYKFPDLYYLSAKTNKQTPLNCSTILGEGKTQNDVKSISHKGKDHINQTT